MLLGMRFLGPVVLTATTLPIVLANVSPGFDLLASMPAGTRIELEGRLDRFHLLPADEQRSIRELDEALARLDPDERRRYLALMRRYGAWHRGLDEPSRRAIDEASLVDRLNQIRERLGPGGSPESPGLDPALWFRSETFNPVPLFDAVALLRVWASLDDQGRRRVESARSFDEKLATLRQLGRERGIDPAPAVREAFATILEAQAGLGLRRLRDLFDEQARGGQRPARPGSDPGEVVAWLLDPFGTSEGRIPPPAAGRLSAARLVAIRMAELEYLREIRERPEPGSSADLAAFEVRLPDWYRGTLDALPPEIARLRLRGLRRLALSDPDLDRWLSSMAPVTPSPGSAPPSNPGGGRPVQVMPF